MTLSGPHKLTCHCGAVELSVMLSNGTASASRCNCSFCSRRGAIALTAPTEGVRVVRGADKLTLYQWGTHSAKHYFCSVCGIYTHHQRRSDPRECGVNAAAIEGVEAWKLKNVPWTDGLNHPKDKPSADGQG